MAEYWDVYDVHRQKQEGLLERGKALPEGAYHLVVHGCIFNSQGEMLIQQRQPFKQGWSNLWDITVGGSALAGETSQMAMSREMAEEIGFHYDFKNRRPHMTIQFEGGFDDIYLLIQDVALDSLQLQPEEVQAVGYASEAEILHMIEEGIFIPYYPSFIQMLFAMAKTTHLGMISKLEEK